MMSFDVTSLCTNVPVDEAIHIITTLLNGIDLPTGYIDGVSHCLTTGYFLWRVINREHVEEFIAHLNSVHSSILFATEKEKDGMLPVLDNVVSCGTDGWLSHTVYRKPTHTDRYLRVDSQHHTSHLASVPRTLINRALNPCDLQYIYAEFDHLRLKYWKIMGITGVNVLEWRARQARTECAQIVRGSRALYEPCMSCAKEAHQTIAVIARAQLAGRSQSARELRIRGTFARCGRTLMYA
ncbi:hypothetical protein HF086_002497 [Spodoptera exigua]|uniref:Helix-turn-helix domain-containing protein n=1 Tax=Spodoptera exigua TaxID=7107 RepID=A0A922MMA9_SPOEX|nr:hypothetical protein HF086_002497 [Spodoptera exigua]